MNTIDAYLVRTRSISTVLHSDDIDPDSFNVSVLNNGNKSFIVIDRENDRIFACSAQNSCEAVKSYIDWIYGVVDAEDENGRITRAWARECVHVAPCYKDEWELVEER